MINHRLALVLLLSVFLPTGTTLAQQALVRSYNNTSLEIGQAYLAHYGGRCLAILPTHVANEAGSVAALLKEGTEALLGETKRFSDLGDDVTVADIIGGITGDCGVSTLAVSRAVGSRVKANALASIRSVNGDGSIAQLSVTIIDDDGTTFLRVQPTNDMNQLRKGQSGSLLMSGDSPIGMLLSVNARFGVGKVIRLDRMFDKLDSFLAGGSSSSVITNTESVFSPSVSATSEITSWSAMAIDAGHRAVNLVATDDSPPWIANVETWPVEIEMALPGDRTAISGIELDGTAVSDPGTLPGIIELMISSTTEGRRWRSVAGGGISFSDGTAMISFSPSWARHVKLIISSAGNGANIIALNRLRVVEAN